MAKIRKQIYLTPQQNQRLKVLKKEYGLSGAENIRRAIDEYLLKFKFAEKNEQPKYEKLAGN
jgi:hypothetical protein